MLRVRSFGTREVSDREVLIPLKWWYEKNDITYLNADESSGTVPVKP